MWTDRTKKSIYSLKALMIIAVINRFGLSKVVQLLNTRRKIILSSMTMDLSYCFIKN